MLALVSGCQLIQQAKERVPSILKVQVVDENNEPYGYVTVSLIDSNNRAVLNTPMNERGFGLFREGLTSGRYTFVVKNAAGVELQVLEPDSVFVPVGRTVEVTIKVKRVIGTGQSQG